jgi:acetolactate synthase regulatory subunit
LSFDYNFDFLFCDFCATFASFASGIQTLNLTINLFAAKSIDYRQWRRAQKRGIIMKHIIAVLIENEPGALSRVVGLFSARAYNIESLTVAPTEDPSLSRMTIVTSGSDEVIEQITNI